MRKVATNIIFTGDDEDDKDVPCVSARVRNHNIQIDLSGKVDIRLSKIESTLEMLLQQVTYQTYWCNSSDEYCSWFSLGTVVDVMGTSSPTMPKSSTDQDAKTVRFCDDPEVTEFIPECDGELEICSDTCCGRIQDQDALVVRSCGIPEITKLLSEDNEEMKPALFTSSSSIDVAPAVFTALGSPMFDWDDLEACYESDGLHTIDDTTLTDASSLVGPCDPTAVVQNVPEVDPECEVLLRMQQHLADTISKLNDEHEQKMSELIAQVELAAGVIDKQGKHIEKLAAAIRIAEEKCTKLEARTGGIEALRASW